MIPAAVVLVVLASAAKKAEVQLQYSDGSATATGSANAARSDGAR